MLGSTLAQSVEATVVDGVNGWTFHPLQQESMMNAINRSLETSSRDLDWMGQSARQVASECTAHNSAAKFCDILLYLSGEKQGEDELIAQPNPAPENAIL